MPPTALTDFTAADWRALNSATQYPSIPTYHALGERGRLTEARNVDFAGEHVDISEKIDGTNARIIIPHPTLGRPVIGSRTELLHHLGDLIANPAQGIVDEVRDLARDLEVHLRPGAGLLAVVFGEVYGGKASSGSKNYSTIGTTGFRVFDVAYVSTAVLDWDRVRIAAWRDGLGPDGYGQGFVDTYELRDIAHRIDFDLVPPLERMGPMSETVAETYAWLKGLTETHARLDESGKGAPEGVVVRTTDRAKIAKIRFEDYERTARATKVA